MAQKTDAELLTQKQIIEGETVANANTAARVGQMFEDIIDSKANNTALIQREFNRAFSAELLFDKNEIEVVQHTMTVDIDFVISPTGNLVDQGSYVIMEVIADGIHALNFISSPGRSFAYIYPAGTVSGVILDAGTYEIYVFYLNGKARVNIPGVSQESSGLAALQAPQNFMVLADGENALDLSWDDVADEVSYQIERSLTGTGGWTVHSTPAAGSTSDTETGITSNSTVYYRIKAIGDGVTHTDSPYATASGTTEDSGDATAPTFTFLPANGNSTWTVNKPITITANEELRNAADNSVIDSTDLLSIITLKETNSGGTDIPFTATIDATKKIITVTPTTGYGASQLVYLAIDDVEDVSGNEITLQSITFTTTSFTYFNGTSNRLGLGDILDTVFSAADGNFWLEITSKNSGGSSSRFLVGKTETGEGLREFYWFYNGSDIYFVYWMDRTPDTVREVRWSGAMDSNEHDWVLKYDGSIDTNDGLDRLTLLKDGVTVGSKTMSYGSGLLGGTLANSPAPLTVGANQTSASVASGFYTEELKDFKVRSAAGSVLEVDIPVLFDGQDVSGNARHGTWV